MKKLLFNPFEKFSETRLLIFGLFTAITCSFIGYFFNTRFDGVLDMHIVKKTSLHEPFIDNGINIITLAVILFIAGLLVNKKTRIIDILNTVLIARIIYCFLPLFNPEFIAPGINEKLLSLDPANPQSLSLSALEIITLGVAAIIMLGALVWYIALLYNGFKTSTNAKNVKHILFFAVGIISAEILSKYIISIINY